MATKEVRLPLQVRLRPALIRDVRWCALYDDISMTEFVETVLTKAVEEHIKGRKKYSSLIEMVQNYPITLDKLLAEGEQEEDFYL